MADITMCKGTNCPIKEKCYRYTAKPYKNHQAFFSEEPFTIKKRKFNCDMYWGESAENIMNTLKDIVK